MKFLKYLSEKSKGVHDWSQESLEKFAKTIGKDPKEEGFFDTCVERMTDHFSQEDAEGFCALLKDKAYGSTYWRGKGKSEKEAKKDTEEKQNVKKLPEK